MKIYTGAFRTSPVESIHVEAYDPPPGIKKELTGTKIPVLTKSNSSYIDTLNTLDNNED